MARRNANGGMLIFTLIWIGQVISMLGSGLTEFALGVWVYRQTESATAYAMIVLLVALPQILVAPFAGMLADRWDRRWIMILSDTGSALCALTVALLAWTGSLEVWHAFLAVLVTAICGAIQFPAYATLVTLLVPNKHLGRANGMIEMAWATTLMIAPILAATLIEAVSISGVILIDVITFAIGVSLLLIVRIPRTESPVESGPARASIFQGISAGWTYIAGTPGLRGLLTFCVLVNLSVGLYNALFVPMVLSASPNSVLGIVMSVGGAGLIAGGLLLAAWGGPKNRVRTMIAITPLWGLSVLIAGVQTTTILLAAASFLYCFFQPFLNAFDQSIWQAKVPFDIQGRVFSARRAIQHTAGLVAYVAAGPLVDRVFNPLLVEDGPLASSVGQMIGVGPGRGIGLLFIGMGLFMAVAAAWAYLSPRVWHLEEELPDAMAEDTASPTDSQDLVPAA